jgi:hypothetical protein
LSSVSFALVCRRRSYGARRASVGSIPSARRAGSLLTDATERDRYISHVRHAVRTGRTRDCKGHSDRRDHSGVLDCLQHATTWRRFTQCSALNSSCSIAARNGHLTPAGVSQPSRTASVAHSHSVAYGPGVQSALLSPHVRSPVSSRWPGCGSNCDRAFSNSSESTHACGVYAWSCYLEPNQA